MGNQYFCTILELFRNCKFRQAKRKFLQLSMIERNGFFGSGLMTLYETNYFSNVNYYNLRRNSTKYNSQGFSVTILGNSPVGAASMRMFDYIKSLNIPKGSFRFPVEEKGFQTISTVIFKKL